MTSKNYPVPPCPEWMSEPDRYTWDLGDIEGEDRRWREQRFPLLPHLFQMPIAREYRKRYFAEGRKEANLYLLEMTEQFDKKIGSLGIDMDEIRQYAERRVKDCLLIYAHGKSEEACYLSLCQYTAELGFSPPLEDNRITKAGAIQRMCDPLWWRNSIRRKYSELFEVIAIKCGLVHAKAGIYASDETIQAFKVRRKRNLELLQSMEAINEMGQTYVLSDLVALSVSNPKNRRNELMARLYGFDLIAKKLNHAGLFITITCPSRMHARYKSSGDANPKFDGTTPREANKYLGQLWARIRASLKNAGIHIYGFRVAEPQHDGTPHWHILLYTTPSNVETIKVRCLDYALWDSPDEKGAQESRCKFKEIDWNKGTGIGYMAKYISKNIDGEHLEHDINGGDAKDNSLRVVAWASVHRIRQFQQFGGPPVTCWRELRKIDDAPEGLLTSAREAADEGNWELFTETFGGTEINRKDQHIKLLRAVNEEPGRYGEPKGEEIFGLTDGRSNLITRLHDWKISRSKAKGRYSLANSGLWPTWSSVNNCKDIS